MDVLFLALISIPTLLVLFVVNIVAKQYKRCPSNRILVIYGKISGEKTAKCIHGGGTFLIPLIQDYAFLSLEPIVVNIDLRGALSKKNIRVNVPSTFTVGISRQGPILLNAAERLLGLTEAQIAEQSKDIIFGQLRLVIATLSIEEINQDREKFLDMVEKNVNIELNKIGLEVINVNITDITDESGYIEAIGKKAAAEAVQQALVDVADQEKQGAIGVETAKKEKDNAVAQQRSMGHIGQKEAEKNQRVRLAVLEADAIAGENASKANIAASNAELFVQEAKSSKIGQVARAESDRDIFLSQKQTAVAKMQAAELAKEEVEKQKLEVQAEAQAEQNRRIAKGKADAALLEYHAQAQGTLAVMQAKAKGYQEIIQAAGGKTQEAATLLLIEKLENIVAKQVEAIKNVKIDKITVWDSQNGASESPSGGSTARFLRDFSKMIPPIHDIAKQAGLELPSFFGTVEGPKNDPEPAKKA
jgi:flotillin